MMSCRLCCWLERSLDQVVLADLGDQEVLEAQEVQAVQEDQGGQVAQEDQVRESLSPRATSSHLHHHGVVHPSTTRSSGRTHPGTLIATIIC